MTWDNYKNFAVSTVATPPSPATSGTSLTVAAGHGTRFGSGAVAVNAVVWPANTSPTPTTAEVVRITDVSSDTLTITRTQESSSARTIIAGDQIAIAITVKALTDIHSVLTPTPRETTDTFDVEDGDLVIEHTAATAKDCTVPTGLTQSFIEIRSRGVGVLTVSADVGVTFEPAGDIELGQYDTLSLAATADPDTWSVAAEFDGSDLQDQIDTLSTGLSTVEGRTLTAGNGLSGGGDLSGDRSFAVNVDDSTLEISSDTLRNKDGGITNAKLATATKNTLENPRGEAYGFYALGQMPLSSQVVVANRLYYNRFRCLKSMTATGISYGVSGAASSNDACCVAILNSSGTVIAVSSSTTGQLNSTGAKTISFTASVALTAGTDYFAVMTCAVGGTGATVGAVNTASGVMATLVSSSPGTADAQSWFGGRDSITPATLAAGGSIGVPNNTTSNFALGLVVRGAM